jgi:TPR repeat protein
MNDISLAPLSLDATIAITGPSKRTWWRRISEGSVVKRQCDKRGRTMISLAAVIPLVAFNMTTADLERLLSADDGDAEAQDDMGQLFSTAGDHQAERYWLELSARQDYPNAMQCLARCCLGGDGMPRDENLAIMWLARAASHGHVIAIQQMQFLRSGMAPASHAL